MLRASGAILFCGLIFHAGGAAATPIVDQSNVQPAPALAGDFVASNQFLAQSFTVGIPGGLAEIDLELYNLTGASSGDDFLVKLLQGAPVDGSPLNFGVTLFASTIPFTSVPLVTPPLTAVTVAPHVAVVAGEVLTIVLEQTGHAARNDVVWSSFLGPYAGGTTFFSADTLTWSLEGAEAGFQTWVEPPGIQSVPEPRSVALLLTGIGCAFLRRGRRSATASTE